MICGNNVFREYESAKPYDYFFTQNGWSIWGTATWRNRSTNRSFPFDYAKNAYIQRCLKDNLTPFWYRKVKGYSEGKLVDNHIPGGEYYHAANSALFHRLCIIPTYNLISNQGYVGENTNLKEKSLFKAPPVFNLEVFEMNFPINHPKYVINDIYFGKQYEKLLYHDVKSPGYILRSLARGIVKWLPRSFIKVIKSLF